MAHSSITSPPKNLNRRIKRLWEYNGRIGGEKEKPFTIEVKGNNT